MGIRWTPEVIRFMRDAAEHSQYYQRIAERAAAFFPPDSHVCDAGCGLGELSIALLPYCERVTAIDQCPAPVASLRERLTEHQRKGIHPVCCDILTDCPENRYDAMVFCLFGSIEEILKIVSAQCEGAAVVIKRDYLGHLISSGESFSNRYSANHAEDYLRQMEIPCYAETFTLEMGQPFRNLEDAERFFRIYNRSQDVSFDGFRQRLTAGPSPDFPYYLPVVKPLRLLAFQAEDVRMRWET